MRFPPYSVINNRLLVDAYFVRDYHGDDSTIFASGSNKNGMNPSNWSCPVSQSIPDKNEILDMMLHVRRAGPNVTDSMWLFGEYQLRTQQATGTSILKCTKQIFIMTGPPGGFIITDQTLAIPAGNLMRPVI